MFFLDWALEHCIVLYCIVSPVAPLVDLSMFCQSRPFTRFLHCSTHGRLRPKTHGIENRRIFSTPKTDMAKTVDEWRRCCFRQIIHFYSFKSEQNKRKRNPNVFTAITNKPNENDKLQSITTVSVDYVLPKIDLAIEHVLIGVDNQCCFPMKMMTHVPKAGSENRRRLSTACVFGLTKIACDWCMFDEANRRSQAFCPEWRRPLTRNRHKWRPSFLAFSFSPKQCHRTTELAVSSTQQPRNASPAVAMRGETSTPGGSDVSEEAML